MDLGLRGRRALVMGASTGLGHATAAALTAEGAKVAISARGAERLAAAAAELGAVAIACDTTVPGAAAKLVADAQQQLGPLDILVVNTGGPPPGVFAALDETAWRTAFD